MADVYYLHYERWVINTMHPTLTSRIEAIFNNLDSACEGGFGMSSASKGVERELFVTNVLEQVFPPHYQFCSGDIIDSKNHQSGQVDVVLQQPRGFSFPLASFGPRLYLAENVSAVIEVKSDLVDQWKEVQKTAKKLARVKRVYASDSWSETLNKISEGKMTLKGGLTKEKVTQTLTPQIKDPKNIGKPRIPFIAVGFTGWKKDETLTEKLLESDLVDGIMVLDQKKFATRQGRQTGKEIISGPSSLLAMLQKLDIEFRNQPDRFSPSVLYR